MKKDTSLAYLQEYRKELLTNDETYLELCRGYLSKSAGKIEWSLTWGELEALFRALSKAGMISKKSASLSSYLLSKHFTLERLGHVTANSARVMKNRRNVQPSKIARIERIVRKITSASNACSSNS